MARCARTCVQGGDLSLESLPNFLRIDLAEALENKHPHAAGPKTIPNFFMQNRLLRATREIANPRGSVTCEGTGPVHVRQNSIGAKRTSELPPWSTGVLQGGSQADVWGFKVACLGNWEPSFLPSTISTRNRDAHSRSVPGLLFA